MVLKQNEKFFGCIIDPKQNDISNYKKTCKNIIKDFHTAYRMTGNDFYLLHGPQTEADNDSCGIWVLAYLENTVSHLEQGCNASTTLNNLSVFNSKQNNSCLNELRNKYANMYTANKIYVLRTDEFNPPNSLKDKEEHSALIEIEDNTPIEEDNAHLYSESRLTNINAIMQQSNTSLAGRLKTATNILPAVVISIVIFATCLVNLYMLIASENDDHDGFDWAMLLLSILQLLETSALTSLNIGYIGLKQNEQFEAAEGLLDKSVLLIENEEKLRNDARAFIEKHKALHNLEDGVYENKNVGRTIDLKPRLNAAYRPAVYHPRPINYLTMGLMSLAAIGLDITAIALSIKNKPQASAGTNIGSAGMLMLATGYTAYYKIKDASKIRDINNQLVAVSEKLFEHGTKIILSLTLALAGKFDTEAFDFSGNNQPLLKQKKYPKSFLEVIEQANDDFRPILIKINELVLLSLSAESENEQLLNDINTLRVMASTLLNNHVKIAENLDNLEKKMPYLQTQNATRYNAVKPLEDIAKKLNPKTSKKNSNLPEKRALIQNTQAQLNHDDIQVILDVQKNVNERFQKVSDTLEQQGIKIKKLEKTIECMKIEHDEQIQSIKTEMKTEHEKQIQSMETKHEKQIQTMETKHEKQIQSMKTEHNEQFQRMEEKMEKLIQETVITAVTEATRPLYAEIVALTAKIKKQEPTQNKSTQTTSPRFFNG